MAKRILVEDFDPRLERAVLVSGNLMLVDEKTPEREPELVCDEDWEEGGENENDELFDLVPYARRSKKERRYSKTGRVDKRQRPCCTRRRLDLAS